jgi:hypothetical protein
MKIGFFETKPGEKSMSALISILSFAAAVWFSYLTIQLAKVPGASLDVGIWIVSGFMALCGGVKLGRSGIEMWKDVKSDNTTTTQESTTKSETKGAI